MERFYQFADKIKACYGNLSYDKLIEILARTDNIKRCPAKVSFEAHPCLLDGELAKAFPNDPINWTEYTIYVRLEFKNNHELLIHILAHELFHVIAGPMLGEDEADLFAARLLGISHLEFSK